MVQRYYIQKLERKEVVLRIIRSSNNDQRYIIDRTNPGAINDGNLVSEVRLGEVQNNQLEVVRELTTTELAMLVHTQPQIDPLANEYGKPNEAPEED